MVHNSIFEENEDVHCEWPSVRCYTDQQLNEILQDNHQDTISSDSSIEARPVAWDRNRTPGKLKGDHLRY